MANAYRSDHWIPIQHVFQVLELAFAAAHVYLAILQNGDPGGIVAPVLELSQTLQDQRRRVSFTDVSDNAAHYFLIPFIFSRFCSVQPSRTRSWRSLKANAPAGTS